MGVATNLKASSVVAARCTLCDNDDFIVDDVTGLSGITTLMGCNCGTTIIPHNVTIVTIVTFTVQVLQWG